MEDQRLAVHRTIIVVDVEGFGDQRRTNPEQVAVRDGLHQAMQDAFGRAGIPWDQCGHEDRGDGVFILVPAEVPKALLGQSLPPALVTALRAHNAGHPERERIRLRMALHAGEVQYDKNGVTSAAVNLTFRLLEARQLKAALASSPGVLAVIVSSWFFDEVVRHGHAAPGYRAVTVSVKETTTIGWICLPDQVHPAGWAGPAGQQATRLALAEDDGRLPGQVAAARALRLAPRPVFLAGREELLAELDARLAGNEGLTPRVAVLCGLGGAGKTSVALECAHRLLGEVGVAWQFGAEDPAVLAAGFGELAAQLGAGDRGDPVAAVHAVLAAYPAEWLLVFDNAPDWASVVAFLPPAGRGRVVITSRSQIWPPGQALDVPVLDVGIAAGFLVNRTGDRDWEAARELVVELGCLPLALEQAAAYIQASGDNLAGYLGSFRQRRSELLARGEPTGYSETVATTWTLAFRHLHEAAPRAVGLLRLLANCAPEAIPLRLLLRRRPGLEGRFGAEVAPVLVPLLEDELEAKDAIAALRRYSLVTPAADGSVSVHRLVQAVTLGQMPDDLAKAWQQATAALIEAAIPGDTVPPEIWPVCAALLPHARVALADDRAGMARLADYLGEQGNYASARELQQLVLDARYRVLGAEHPDTLAARHELARWTGQAGDPAAARDQFAALVPEAERMLGSERPDVLAARHELARWTGLAGDPAGARDQFAALVPVIEEVLGAEHLDTLTARHEFARWTGQAGDAAGARDQLAALVSVAERVLGAEHPDTLIARQHLPRWTGRAGDPARARDQLAALLPVRERVLGPEHPDTFVTRGHLAYWAGRAGDAAGARDQFAVLIPVMERVLGAEHPDTLTGRHELARWIGQTGDPAEGRDRLAALLPERERVIGAEHPDLLNTEYHLACFTGQAGDPAGARDQLAALLPVRERVLGAEHPDILLTRASLADWIGQAGDPVEAKNQLAALMPVIARVLGTEHPDALTVQRDLFRWTGQAGDPATARDRLGTLVPVIERVQGPAHPDALIARGHLAYWTGRAGDAADAQDQFAVLVPEAEQVLGTEHPDTLTARHELARWTGQAGDPAAARDQFAALLPMRKRVLGTEHPDTLAARKNLDHWTWRADGNSEPSTD